MANKMVEVEVAHGPYQKIIKVPAEVCQKCGERIYSRHAEEMMAKVEEEMIAADQKID